MKTYFSQSLLIGARRRLAALACVALTACGTADRAAQSEDPRRLAVGVSATCDAAHEALVEAYVAQVTRVDGVALYRDESSIGPDISAAFSGTPVTGDAESPTAIAVDARGLVYTVVNGMLNVRRLTSTGNLERVADLPVDVNGADVLIREPDARLVIVGHGSVRKFDDAAASPAARLVAPSANRTVIIDVDIVNPHAPAVVRRVEIDGTLLGSLRARNRVHPRIHVVTRFDVRVPDVIMRDTAVRNLRAEYRDLADSDAARRVAIEAELTVVIRTLLESTAWADTLPQTVDHGAANGASSSASLSCDNIHVPAPAQPARELVVISTFDGDLAPLRSDASLGSGQRVYANANNVFAWQSESNVTVIRRFSIEGSLTGFRASAGVSGVVRPDGDMDERDGLLRVVSTDEAEGSGPRVLVTTLAIDSGADGLRAVSEFEVIRDAALSAVTFDGDGLFIATRAGVNAVHGVDLSDPLNPALAASAPTPLTVHALRMLDAGRMLALAHDGSDDEHRPLQLSSYDVPTPALLAESYRGPVSASGSAGVCLDLRSQCGAVYHSAAGVVALPTIEVSADGALEFVGVSVLDVTHPGVVIESMRMTMADTGGARVPRTARFGVFQIGMRVILIGVTSGGMVAAPVSTVPAMF